ncbi:MAG TPA: SAM-dependent methyltransferase [Pyrinomonadaceae bacterium]|nr:SAM-dependent methyltransferase [Pyrinomonadaceae bacterium]
MPLPLAERLKETIQREGPVTFHDWMKAALYDPAGGYYRRADLQRWGREGDYRTSPERSELFAATFARYFATLYQDSQEPEGWTIVECGAGDGTFAAGVLHSLSDRFPDVFAATRYFVYDVSDDALHRARETLAGFGDRVEFYSDFELLPAVRGVFFSNELLDAFPVHRVTNGPEGLSELYVTVTSAGDFAWAPGQLSTPRLAEFIHEYSLELAPGQIIEINLEIDDWFSRLQSKIRGGFVVTVDYGAESDDLYNPTLRPEGTLRAFAQHGFVDDLLAQPGDHDLTASVNWTHVKRAGERHGFELIHFESQDKFLLRAGLVEELEHRLSRMTMESDKLALTTGAREMILPTGMASSFQVLVQKRVEVADVP